MIKEDLEFFDVGEGEITGIDNKDDVTTEADEKATNESTQSRKIDIGKDELIDFDHFNNEDSIIKGEGDSSSSSSSNNLYLNFAKALNEKGVIGDFDNSLFESEDNSETDVLMSLVKKAVDSNIDEYRGKVSGNNLEALLALERGESIDNYLTIKKKSQSLDKISLEDLESDDNTDLRTDLIRDYYKETTNFSDERISKNIQRMVDLGEDVEESKIIYSDMKKAFDTKAEASINEEKQANIKAQSDFNEKLSKLRSEVDNIDLSFLGGKTSTEARDKIYDMLTKPISSTSNINAVSNKRNEMGAVKFDIILAALIDKGIFDGDLSKLSSKQRQTVMNDLQRSIERSDFQTGHGNGSRGSTGSSADGIFSRRR